MKKIMTMTALSLLIVVGANAQTMYDAAQMGNKDLNGTARFVGMGGAMGALGGDISTIGTNPAGIGIYRSNDFMTSFGFSSYGTKSTFGSSTFNSDKVRGSFDNIGFVFASKIGNETPLRYVNFGFNYKKAKSFYKNMEMGGSIGNNSQTFQMAAMSDGIKDFGDYPFDNDEIGWLSILGFDGYLIDQFEYDNPETGKKEYFFEGFARSPQAKFRSEERGGIDQYDFNVAFNINDRVYFGATIGAYSVDYNKYTYYQENFASATLPDDPSKIDPLTVGEGYNLQSRNQIKGSGFDFKFGAIFRPFENSPLRIGLAFHTPTFYSLDYTTSAKLESKVWLNTDEVDNLTMTTVDSYQRLGNKDMVREFNLRTPWTYNVSLGYTVGKSLALGAEYEYKDYASTKFSYPEDGAEMVWETSTANKMMKGVHTVRLGAEYKVIPQFAIRAGYNYSTSAFTNDAYKALDINSINTDTDFANSKALSNYTLGIGYRGSMFYADLAYKLSSYKADFYAFDSVDLAVTNVTNTRSQVLFTLGMRF